MDEVITHPLILIAGSRSSGKSTFIDWCKNASKKEQFPTALQQIATVDEPIYFMELGNWANQFHEQADEYTFTKSPL